MGVRPLTVGCGGCVCGVVVVVVAYVRCLLCVVGCSIIFPLIFVYLVFPLTLPSYNTLDKNRIALFVSESAFHLEEGRPCQVVFSHIYCYHSVNTRVVLNVRGVDTK